MLVVGRIRIYGGWVEVRRMFCFSCFVFLFVIVGNSLLEIGDSVLVIGERFAVKSN